MSPSKKPDASKILLVEGYDDQGVIEAFYRRHYGEKPLFVIKPRGGVDRLIC